MSSLSEIINEDAKNHAFRVACGEFFSEFPDNLTEHNILKLTAKAASAKNPNITKCEPYQNYPDAEVIQMIREMAQTLSAFYLVQKMREILLESGFSSAQVDEELRAARTQ